MIDIEVGRADKAENALKRIRARASKAEAECAALQEQLDAMSLRLDAETARADQAVAAMADLVNREPTTKRSDR